MDETPADIPPRVEESRIPEKRTSFNWLVWLVPLVAVLLGLGSPALFNHGFAPPFKSGWLIGLYSIAFIICFIGVVVCWCQRATQGYWPFVVAVVVDLILLGLIVLGCARPVPVSLDPNWARAGTKARSHLNWGTGIQAGKLFLIGPNGARNSILCDMWRDDSGATQVRLDLSNAEVGYYDLEVRSFTYAGRLEKALQVVPGPKSVTPGVEEIGPPLLRVRLKGKGLSDLREVELTRVLGRVSLHSIGITPEATNSVVADFEPTIDTTGQWLVTLHWGTGAEVVLEAQLQIPPATPTPTPAPETAPRTGATPVPTLKTATDAPTATLASQEPRHTPPEPKTETPTPTVTPSATPTLTPTATRTLRA